MQVQLSKEWRLLRPGVVAAVGLGLLPVVVPLSAESRADASYVFAFCMFLGGVFLGIETFGREFHQQTSTLWLAQPLSRARLWRTKLISAGMAVAGVTLLHWAVMAVRALWHLTLPDFFEFSRPFLGILGGAALGLCWSVWLRQTWAAFWMSLITPGALMIVIQLLVYLYWPMPKLGELGPEPDLAGMFALTFGLVSVMAYFLARRRFEHLEDLGAVGEDVQLSPPRFVRSLFRMRAGTEREVQSAGHSLWWKEVRLQQVNLALAFGFALLMVLAQFLRGAVEARSLEFVDAMWALWSLLPLTIGLATFAEERRLGVDSWQETLPVSRARRWWIKIGAAFALSFIIGVILPLIGEAVTHSAPLRDMLQFHLWAWVIATTVGLYVSSLARNLVHAVSILVPFGVALGMALSGGIWLTRALTGESSDGSPCRIQLGWHFTVVTGLLMSLAALWLAWKNSAPGRNEMAVIWKNGSILTATWMTGLLVVSGMRARAWEWLRPEPKAGPAMAVYPGVHPDVAMFWPWAAVVLAPDGGLWLLGSYADEMVMDSARGRSASYAPHRMGEGYAWLATGFDPHRPHLYAVRSDGTLWRWGPTMDRPQRLTDLASSWKNPTQVGTDSDWQSVATAWLHTVALKKDGSLWGWGMNEEGQLGQPEADYLPAPVQMGTATNWTHITAGQGDTLASNRDGEIWEWGWVGRPPRGTSEGKRRLWVPRRIASGIAWDRLFTSGTGVSLGLAADGQLWILRKSIWGFGEPTPPMRWLDLDVHDTILGWDTAYSIDRQGRLLRWGEDPRLRSSYFGVPDGR